jgi:hypothetical protein
MRTKGVLVGLSLLAWGAAADAAGATSDHAAPPSPVATDAPAVAAAAETTPVAAPRRLQVGVQFLALPLGELSAAQAGLRTEVESRFAMGAGLSVGYDVFHGLVVGVAPQVIVGAKPRPQAESAGNEYDVMGRIAYRYVIPSVAVVYAEVLPGYSMHYITSDTAKGFVLGGGVGCELDVSEHAFVNAGLGYQKGWQTLTATSDFRTSFARVALGVGARF